MPHYPDGSSTPCSMRRVLAVSGGIGGAKLALGLYRVLQPDELIVVANTGDDFEHLGLCISPDVDTLMYTLAGISNLESGWGRANETWTFMSALGELGGETWFRLGDGDLATNLERTRRLKQGQSLSHITDDFRQRLGIRARLLPMSDDPVRTLVETRDRVLSLQHYFVKESCTPEVTGFRFDGADTAQPNPHFMEALTRSDLEAVVICPSNPFISVDPVLALTGVRGALVNCSAPIVGVSPIIGRHAFKGPTAKMMRELGLPTTAASICQHYGELLDGFILDNRDAASCDAISPATRLTHIQMDSLRDRQNLARQVLDFAAELRSQGRPYTAKPLSPSDDSSG